MPKLNLTELQLALIKEILEPYIESYEEDVRNETYTEEDLLELNEMKDIIKKINHAK